MDAKLTLSIRPEVIAQAKQWARREGKSLSSLVETFLEKSAAKNLPEEDPLEVFRKFAQSVPPMTDVEIKQRIHDHRMNKYGKGI